MNQILKQALAYIGPIVGSIAMKALKSILNSVYRAFWFSMLDAIAQAEKDFVGGSIKKDWVILKVMDFITQRKKLNRIQSRAVKFLVSKVIDQIISELNSTSGRNWVKVISNIEEHLNKKLEIIDPL